MTMDESSEQPKPAFRLWLRGILMFYVVVATGVATVVFIPLLMGMAWSFLPLVHNPVRSKDDSPRNRLQLEYELAARPLPFDVGHLNSGNWRLACLMGRLAHARNFVERAKAVGVEVAASEVGRTGTLKGITTLTYLNDAGQVRWLAMPSLSMRIRNDETVCVAPDAPVIQLPTPKAVENLKVQLQALEQARR